MKTMKYILPILTNLIVLVSHAEDKPTAICTESGGDGSTTSYQFFHPHSENAYVVVQAKYAEGKTYEVKVPASFHFISWITYGGSFTLAGAPTIYEFSNYQSPSVGTFKTMYKTVEMQCVLTSKDAAVVKSGDSL